MTQEFKRGVIAAAAVAATYNDATTHPYRLDDCIACKLNVVARKQPRKNARRLEDPGFAWMRGVATGLAEMHRRLLHGADSRGVCAVATACGLTIAYAKRVGVSPYDMKELRKAGVA